MEIKLSIEDNKKLESLFSSLDTNMTLGEIYNFYFSNLNYDALYKDGYESFIRVIDVEDKKGFALLEKQYNLKNNFIKQDEYFYKNNPYYKNINPESYKEGKWSLEYGYYQAYESFVLDDIKIKENSSYQEITKMGYFTSKFRFLRVVENGTTWMSITPHEINTMQEDVDKASGNVLVLGLGLGYYPYMISLKENVKSITILEKDHKVIEIFNKHILPLFEHKEKISIIEIDAFAYLDFTLKKFDYYFCDLWHNAEDGFPLLTRLIKYEDKYKTSFSFWIKGTILAHLRRYILIIFQECFQGYKEEDYLTSKSRTDREINSIYHVIKDKKFTSIKEINDFLSEDSLLELTKHIAI